MAGNDLTDLQRATLDAHTAEEHILLFAEFHRTQFYYGWNGRETQPLTEFLTAYLDWLAQREAV